MSRWPLHKAYFWQEAPLFRPLLPLIAGIAFYDCGLPASRYFITIVVLLLCSGMLLLVNSVVRRRKHWMEYLQPLLTLLFFTSLGWCAYAANDSRNRPHWFAKDVDRDAACIVRLLDKPQQRAATTKNTVEVLYTLKEGSIKRVDGKALLYLYHRPDGISFAEGDTLLIPARWEPVRNSGNPFAFDNARFQRRRGILFQQFLSPDQAILIAKANTKDAGFIKRTHNWCSRQISAYVRDSATTGLLQAMLLGDESGFDPELRQAYSETGVIHIVSISGSHVAVLFLLVTGLLFWIRGRHGAWIKYSVGVALVWLYVLMAGAPPSALRSAIMFTIIALGIVVNREGQALNTVFGAAFILLLGEPAWLFSVGFQLSFGAVLSILLFYRPIYSLWPQSNWLGRKAWQAVSASVAAEILTAPLVLYYFHNFPLVFILANLLSVLLVGLCALVGGMAIVALCWIPPLAQLIGQVVTLCVSFFNAAIRWLQRYNPDAFQYLQVDAVELFFIYVMIAGLGICWLRKEKRGLLLALPAASLLVLLLSIDSYQALKQERLIVYSNGRNALVERIAGLYSIPLAGESGGNYNARAAHIGLHAWKTASIREESPVQLINGRTVFLLKDTSTQAYTLSFPVDVLVVCRPLRSLQVSRILYTFRPKDVVLAQRPGAYHLQRWKDSCAAHNAHLYNVAEEGAFVME